MSGSFRKILIINPGGIGDMVMFTPALKVLKNNFPASAIDVFAGFTPAAAEVLKESDIVRNVFNFNFQKSSFFDKVRFICKLRKEKYDLAVVASGVNPFKGSLFALLTGAKNRVGDYERYKWFYTHSTRLDGKKHKTVANLHLLESLKPFGVTVNFEEPFFRIRDEDKQFAEKFILKNNLKGKILIGFSPGVGQKQQFKGWAKENFIELGKKILNNYPNSFILIFGSLSEKELCLEVRNCLGKNAVPVIGQTLSQVAVLIGKCRMFIASDTGLGHIAATTSADLIAIFGPTIPERTGPVGPNVHMISEKCSYRYHDIFTPKYDINKEHQCLKKITPDKVFAKVEEILSKNYGQ